jgi:hypothetical protein
VLKYVPRALGRALKTWRAGENRLAFRANELYATSRIKVQLLRMDSQGNTPQMAKGSPHLCGGLEHRPRHASCRLLLKMLMRRCCGH